MKKVIFSSIVIISAFALTSCEEKTNWCPDGTEWSFFYKDCVPVGCNTCGIDNGGGTVINNDTIIDGPPTTQEFLIENDFSAGNMRWISPSDPVGHEGRPLYTTSDCGTGQVIYSLDRPNYLNGHLNGMRSAYVTVEWQIVQVIDPAGYVNEMQLPLFSGGYTTRDVPCEW